jgi:hypothetical protein
MLFYAVKFLFMLLHYFLCCFININAVLIFNTNELKTKILVSMFNASKFTLKSTLHKKIDSNRALIIIDGSRKMESNFLKIKEIEDDVDFFGLVARLDAKLGVMLFDRVSVFFQHTLDGSEITAGGLE